MRKLLLILTVFISILAITSCFSSLTDTNKSDDKAKNDLTYTLNSDSSGYSVEYLLDNPRYDHLEIPETHEGLPITEIKEIHSGGIKTISIPASVEKIGTIQCPSCTSIEVDKNSKHYKSIGNNLYTADEKTLVRYIPKQDEKSFAVPGTVREIANYAFCKAESLVDVTVPSSVTAIGNYAFWGCTSLERVEIPGSVTYIGSRAFNDCISLESIEIPDSVTTIGDNSEYSDNDLILYGCSSLTSIIVGDSVRHLGWIDFSMHPLLKSVVIGNSVTSIKDAAFSACPDLESIVKAILWQLSVILLSMVVSC